MSTEDYSGFEPRFFDPRNDVAFKKVFVDHADLTKSFLNATLRLEGGRKIQTVEFLPTEQLPKTSESKKSILDVLCTDERGFKYIIEVQNKYMQNYIQRVQYYISHLYSNQLRNKENYLELKPITLLSVLNHSIFPSQINYLSFHENIEKETKQSYLNDMSYAFIELPKFNKKEKELETVEDYWIYTMKEATHLKEAPKDAPEEVKRAYEILEKHTWTPQECLDYEKSKIALMDDLDAIMTAKEEEREEIALRMIKKKMDIEAIIELTELTRGKIKQLIKEEGKSQDE
ncbi:MAG: hypothetical protein B7Y25_02605 [Alphaproteobacteria bacterium 16-39-46]|nr:MAG: hypothetical protein B7Y25_02605 [Alphaproteobacteria bacterium 16-39-46]OZA42638.1 MAG: hypothetical protein B7X84_05375 [Alphaproteobacteria bacterium 17-39-52]HQS83818.1 Rpn family recombination-promoting nuclease/putative transposase [Alphaproteobacteria bacterium]HQS93684.1 Rpn family recombination-promoting nuclease/putative transposase [Alphaproteobacteria bacterium]